MKKRVADILIESLVECGITDCFAVVGGGAMHIDNALAIHPEINKYFCHHEQACAMAAEGYAKACGKMALVSVTSGPGALNTLNGVEGAYVDNVPMIIVAGHPRWDTTVNATGLNLRYRGVQEFDIVPAISGMTKYARTILDPLEIRKEIKRAVTIAMDGRRGPVWLTVPLNIQSAIVDELDLYPDETADTVKYCISDHLIDDINDDIQNSERPVILAGSGIRTGGEVERFREWTAKMKIPVISGALLPDIMYEGAPYYFGASGAAGERRGNFVLQNSDLVIAIGNSLALKQTGFNQELFAPHAKIIMVDATEDEGKKPGLRVDKFVHSDVRTFFDIAFDKVNEWNDNTGWLDYCGSLKEKLGDIDAVKASDDKERVSNHYMWEVLNSKLPDDAMIALGNSTCTHGGLYKSVKCPDQRIIVNYNSGSMGDDLPEAMGMFVASQNDVICVTGDGSIMMNLQEFQTIVHYGMSIKTIIMSNEGYNAIRQTNKNFFNGVYIGCDQESGVSMPDFGKVVSAFDIPYRKCENVGQLDEALDWLLTQEGAAVLEVNQLLDDPIMPRVMSKMREDGSFYTPALHEMSPEISEELMNELMIVKG